MRKYEHPLHLTYFLFMASYRNLHTSGFFSSNLLILSVNRNICHSIHRQKIIFFAILYYFLFPVKPLCWCYLETTSILLSSSTSPAKYITIAKIHIFIYLTFNTSYYPEVEIKRLFLSIFKSGWLNFLQEFLKIIHFSIVLQFWHSVVPWVDL